MSASPVPIKRRADATQNRTLLLQAAEEVFTELGVQAPLVEVSTRAGVGRATLFRNFPDRQTLVLALLERGLEQVAAEATRLQGASDELVQLLRFVLERMAFRAPLVEYWQTAGRQLPQIQSAISHIVSIFDPVVRRAVTSGQCRSDLTADDVLLLLSMFGACAAMPDQRVALVERVWDFAMNIIQSSTPGRAHR